MIECPTAHPTQTDRPTDRLSMSMTIYAYSPHTHCQKHNKKEKKKKANTNEMLFIYDFDKKQKKFDDQKCGQTGETEIHKKNIYTKPTKNKIN